MNTSENLSSDEEGEGQTGRVTQQQLQTLQSLIPNSTKRDKRSILEDACDYLQRIHQETEQIEKELSQPLDNISSSERTSSGPLQRIHQETEQIEKELSQPLDNISSSERTSSGPSQDPKILRVEVEKLEDCRFVVKVSWKKGPGVAGHMQRVIECLDVKMTSIAVDVKNPDEMLTTAFVKVKKEMPKTVEELHDLIIRTAARFGLVQ